MARVAILDASEAFVTEDDVVKFSVDGFDWKVNRVLADENRLYVESLIGKRKAVTTVTSVMTIKRDLKRKEEANHRVYYVPTLDNDDIEDGI